MPTTLHLGDSHLLITDYFAPLVVIILALTLAVFLPLTFQSFLLSV